jgi:hypothetical protein
MPARFHGAGSQLCLTPRLALGDHLFGLLSIELIDAPAGHMWVKHLERSAAGIDSIVMGEIGNPSRTRNNSSFQGDRRILRLPARHTELNGPNRVTLSPLSGVATTVKPAERADQVKRLALTRLSRILAEADADPFAVLRRGMNSNLSTSPG